MPCHLLIPLSRWQGTAVSRGISKWQDTAVVDADSIRGVSFPLETPAHPKLPMPICIIRRSVHRNCSACVACFPCDCDRGGGVWPALFLVCRLLRGGRALGPEAAVPAGGDLLRVGETEIL